MVRPYSPEIKERDKKFKSRKGKKQFVIESKGRDGVDRWWGPTKDWKKWKAFRTENSMLDAFSNLYEHGSGHWFSYTDDCDFRLVYPDGKIIGPPPEGQQFDRWLDLVLRYGLEGEVKK